MLADNLAAVQERVNAACKKAGRNPSEITLIAVSKTKPVSMLNEIYDQGIREFGENKVQEICEKHSVMPDDIHWHMIGHLQTNKVKQVIDKACMIHSVDSVRLAKQINDEAIKKNICMDILLEVNVAEEDTKFGLKTNEIEAFLEEISDFKGIKVKGLMTIAPFVKNPEENRKYFRELKQLCVDLKTKNNDNVDMKYLSMGMTNDFEIAIEEGATHVRVGTAIFGERNYNI